MTQPADYGLKPADPYTTYMVRCTGQGCNRQFRFDADHMKPHECVTVQCPHCKLHQEFKMPGPRIN